ncbi:SusD family protein [Parapedobacter composti]|uniref:SusD family protein n=1 Tax=Parapedobacter composti TaxID=623281 RepID=A0A1I1ILF8_9SPHI|nr:RagB/SusD family nutrient uptake outer membrane protein [Parapedobacter composti]SFC36801.1 SusD family protein [Parapedobacter composti]
MENHSFLSRICIGMIAIVLATSCSKDFLDTDPTDRVSETIAFSSIENANKALSGLYRTIYTQYTNQHRDGHTAMMINFDAMGEDYVRTAPGYVYHRESYRWLAHRNVSDVNVNGFAYYFYYIIISNANMIIEKIDGVEGGEQAKATIKGEALALRAWAYTYLVQLYGKRYDASIGENTQPGVPLVLTTDPAGQPRASVEAVYTQIVNDLDEAMALLAHGGSTAKTHLNLQSVKGIRARVALTMQDWPNAIKYAQEARANSSLMSHAQYLEGFSNISNPEWLWGVSIPIDQVTTYGSFFRYMSANFNSGFTRTNPKCMNSVLYAQIPETDIRKKLWWDGTDEDRPNFPGVLNGDGTPVANQTRAPYQHRKYLVQDPSNASGDVPLMRAAEMYLIEAEARAQSGDADAAEVLYELAVNRDPQYVMSTNTGQSLVNEIWVQRRVELWGEGFRFLDLKRTNSDLDRRNTNHKPDLANILYVPAGANEWQWLIPQAEINSNPAIGPENQNP